MYYISEIVIFAILLVLLSQGVQADTKGIVRPSDKYPLGAATMATFYALTIQPMGSFMQVTFIQEQVYKVMEKLNLDLEVSMI